MVVEGIHVRDIFELVSLVLSLIISWVFRMLSHEKDQYTDFFLFIALKQTNDGPRSSGTRFLVTVITHFRIKSSYLSFSKKQMGPLITIVTYQLSHV